jgi:thiaminase
MKALIYNIKIENQTQDIEMELDTLEDLMTIKKKIEKEICEKFGITLEEIETYNFTFIGD